MSLKSHHKEDEDLSLKYNKTGERPQNIIKNNEPNLRYQDQPKSRQLIELKAEVISRRNHPPMYLKQDLRKYDLRKLGKFDVILVDPPWEEYYKRVNKTKLFQNHIQKNKFWTLDEIGKLPIDEISDSPSFLFLWVGSEHLDDGRELILKWGFKRCEDICWVKTNHVKKYDDQTMLSMEDSWFMRVKEHCLVGLKGDSKKASDTLFIHPNIDTDVVIREEFQFGSTQKPEEVYDIIERFCLGRKRLELFGQVNNVREGWLTIGLDVPESNMNLKEYSSWFEGEDAYPQRKDFKGGRRLGTTPDIQNLRPKSPSKAVPQSTQPSLIII